MKVQHYILLTVILLSLTYSCKPPQSKSNNKLDTLHLKQIFDKKNAWLVDNKYDSLYTILHPDLVYGHSNGWVQTYDDIMDRERKDSLYYQMIDINNMDINVVDHTGIVVGNGKFEGIVGQDSFAINLQFIETYILLDSRWKLLAMQAVKI